MLLGAHVLAAAALIAPAPAAAGGIERVGGIESLSCIGARSFFSCVRRWDATPERLTRDPEDEALAAERERKWLARCRPVVRQDSFGVGRYHYAAPGCEYGRTE
jgi:hypothetical protein